MSRWYRVFGTSDVQPEPARLLGEASALGAVVRGKFHGDDLGWFRADLAVGDDAVPLPVERFLATEEGIRAELNTWAAWLETQEDNPHHLRLMKQMIGTAQVFTLGPVDPDDVADLEPLCLELCRFLARETAGVYQADGAGLFAADGTLLVAEA